MKKEDLFDALGDINNQYIKEAHIKNEKNNFAWVRWGTIVACFGLLVLCSPMITRLFPKVDDKIPTVESLPSENNNKDEDLSQNKDMEILQPEKSNTLVVNEVTNIINADMDVQVTPFNKLPNDVWMSVLEDFHKSIGFTYEEFTDKIPDSYEYCNFYSLSTRGVANLKAEYCLHDYVFEYKTGNGGEVTIAICSFEDPLRDCFIECDNPKQSEINGVTFLIYGMQDSFMVQFSFENINYDIETSNVTLEELEELLVSITEATKDTIEDTPADNNGETKQHHY